MIDWIPLFSAVAVAIIGTAGGWFLVSRQRRALDAEAKKTHADATATITGAAKTMIDRLERSVERLDEKVTQLEAENRVKDQLIEEQEERIEVLEGEVVLVKRRMQEVSKLNVDLLRGNALLCEQIRTFGEEPIWTRGQDPDQDPV